MLLLNIGTLSDSELEYMAEQEQIEDWEEMTREELIESLEEVFGDSTDEDSPLYGNYRFTKSLTDVPSGSLSLPGVTALPETYTENEIFAVLKDANWAYAVWNIAPQKKDELSALQAKLCLRVSAGKQSYDIDIDYDDTRWNFELPWHGCEYKVSVVASYIGPEDSDPEMREEVICTSGPVSSPYFYFSDHIKDLQNPETFRLVFDSLFTKNGRIVKNDIVASIFDSVIENQKKGGRK